MANFFDQFDTEAKPTVNFFDQFDVAQQPDPQATQAPVDPYWERERERSQQDVAGLTAMQEPKFREQQAKRQEAEEKGRSWTDTILKPPVELSKGVVEGLTNIAGAPGDIVNAGMSMAGLPVADPPPLGSKAIQNIIGLGYEGVAGAANAVTGGSAETDYWKPSTHPVDRLARTVGRYSGEAAVPVGAGIAAAAKPTIALSKMRGNTLGSAFNEFFVEPARLGAARMAGKELSVAAAAGTGASTAHQALGDPSNPGWVNGALELGGAGAGLGVLGSTKATMNAARGIGSAIKEFFRPGTYSDRVVREAVTDDMLRAARAQPDEYGNLDSSVIANRIMSSDNPARVSGQVVEGFSPTTNEFIPTPEMQALVREREALDPSSVFVARKEANNTAIENAIGKLEPEGAPGVLREVLAQERDKQLSIAAGQTKAAGDAFSAAETGLQPALTAEGRGANVRSALEDARAVVKEQENAAWEPINQSQLRVDPAPIRGQLAAADREMSQIELMDGARPKQIGMLEAIMDVSAPSGIPIREVVKAKSRVGNAANVARNAGAVDDARVAGRYGQAIEQATDEVIPAELRGHYDTARAVTRDRAERFDRDTTGIGQVLQKRDGRYTVPDNSVTKKFVQSTEKNISDFKSLIRETGTDARTREAIRDQMLADVRSQDLLKKPAALSRHLEQYKEVLDEFPDLRTELSSAGNLKKALDEARNTEVAQLRRLGSEEVGGYSPIGRFLKYGDEKAEQSIKTVLASSEPAKALDEILSFVGNDPKAVEGAKKAFWGLMQKEGRIKGGSELTAAGDAPWHPRALAAYLEDPTKQAVLRRLYKDNPEHLESLKGIAEAVRHYDPRAGKTSIPLELQRGPKILPEFSTMASMAYAWKRGIVGPAWLGTTIAARVTRALTRNAQDSAYYRVLDNALTDPAFAANLLRENNPANRAILSRKAKGWRAGALDDLLRDENEADDQKFKSKVMERSNVR